MVRVLLAVLVSSSAAAAPRPVVAFLPPGSGDARLMRLGLLMNARASRLVEQSGRFSELHVKQVLAMAEAEGLSQTELDQEPEARAARVALGADLVVIATLEPEGDGTALSGKVLLARGERAFSAKLPPGSAGALAAGSEAISAAVLGGPPAKGATPQPTSSNDEAVDALASCYATVIKQKLGVTTPAMMVGEELDAAREACATASRLGKGLSHAVATEALALALLGEDAEASAKVASLAGQDVAEPLLLARFFLVSRFQSGADAVAFLESEVKAHPGQLLALNYLADTLGVLGQHAKAVEAWKAYLAAVPASPYGYGRMSRELARLGKHAEAVAAARRGLTLAPKSREAALQLGSRLIDAGKLADAVKVLEPVGGAPDARAEALLRLGWAQFQLGKVDKAKAAYRRALELGTAPSEWRTRARAHADLALLAAKAGKPDEARAALRAAVDSGFSGPVDPSLEDVWKTLDAKGPATTVKETSPLPVNARGEVDPSAPRPAPPRGYVPITAGDK